MASRACFPSAAKDRLGPTRTNAASNKGCFALVFLQVFSLPGVGLMACVRDVRATA